MLAKKEERMKRAKSRLESQLLTGVKSKGDIQDIPLTEKDKERIKEEITTIDDKLNNRKKAKVDNKGNTVIEVAKDKWFIDIYQIHLAYVKNSERRKLKGKSRKKLRKTRSTTFVKSVVMQPGMMQAYRDGKMGISPKNHSFRARKDEPNYFN